MTKAPPLLLSVFLIKPESSESNSAPTSAVVCLGPPRKRANDLGLLRTEPRGDESVSV